MKKHITIILPLLIGFAYGQRQLVFIDCGIITAQFFQF